MNALNWNRFRKCLWSLEALDNLQLPFDPQARRFLTAITGGAVADGDVAGLLRTVLRSRSVHLGTPAELDVPIYAWVPSKQTLSEHGMDVVVSTENSLSIRARPWKPSWLEGIPDERVYRQRVNRYTIEPVATDPVVKDITGFESYRSSGQATAVRAACTIPRGETLLINLPTGAGKSLAFEIAFHQAAARAEAALLVAPTTALALDHEDRLKNLGIDGVAAYHGGLPDGRKQKIRRDFREGDVSVVLASPESALSALSRSLRFVAERGRLTTVAIDEAHMVSGWGIDFRPEYQLLGGFMRELAELAPASDRRPTTLLLSATVTQQTRDDLRSVFGDFTEVAAVSIRPEPEYWWADCRSPDEKLTRVTEAVRHLPRPMLVYTSLREEARTLFEAISDQCKVERIALIRGGDIGNSGGRDPVITDWAEGALDVVVATSAFGLGIDNSDVRAVVHACLPETADRFYQEVGRGGRDGRNSVSLLLPSMNGRDLRVARRLSRKRLITPDKGWPRWRAMKLGKALQAVGQPLHWYVDLDQPPVGVTRQSDANRLWNLRTLILMQMAEMVQLSNDDRVGGESEISDWERWVGVEVLKPDVVNNEGAWHEAFSTIRSRRLRAGRADLEAVLRLIREREPYSNVFSEIYKPPRGGVASAPGFDPVTRSKSIADDSVAEGLPSVIGWPQMAAPQILESLRVNLFSYIEVADHSRLERIVVGLVAKGIYDLEIPPSLMTSKVMREIRRRHPFPIVRPLSETPRRNSVTAIRTELPTHSVLVMDSSLAPAAIERRIRRQQRYLPHQIILISESTRATHAPQLSLAQVLSATSINVLEREIDR